MSSEIIQNPFYHYTYVFDKNTGDLEYPDVYLLTKSLHKKGQLYPVSGLKIVVKANDADEISFDFYKYLDNIEQELYGKLKTDSVVYVKGFGCFQLKVNEYDKEEGIYKSVSGESLANIELSNILVTLEVNNENDILVSDYENESVTDYMPTVFYRDPEKYDEYNWTNTNLTDEEKKNKIMQSSLLHRVLSYAPHYQIGHIDKSLFYVQRTFSWTNAYVNDVLNDIAQEVGCIFTFETYLDDNGNTVRKINAYDVSYCTKCYNDSSILLSYKSYDTSKFRSITNGVCDNCGRSEFVYDYGSDTDIFITTENLTDGISLQPDGEIKNVFKITGGDDLITNTVQAVNMGSNKIMLFSDDTKSEMPTELREKLDNYFEDQEKYKTDYESLIETQYNVIDLIQYLQSGKMPQPIDENKDIQEEVKYLINSIRTYYDNDFYIESYDKGERCYLGHKETVSASTIRNMFTLFLDRGYSVRVTNGELSDDKQSPSDYFIRWNGIVKIYETSNSDNYAEIHCSNNNTTYVEYNEIFSEGSKLQETYPYFTIRLAFGDENTTHYSKYIEQFCNQKLASYKQVEYKNEEQKPWKEYCYERLKSYSDGYQACLESLNELELQQSIDSLKGIIYNVMSNYSSIKSNIDSQMSLLVKQINALYRYWGNYTYEIDKYGNKTYSPDYVSEDFNVDYVSVLQDMADKTSNSYVGDKPIACGKCGSSNVAIAIDSSGIQYNYCKSCGDTDSIITYGDIAKQVADKSKTASNPLVKDIDRIVKFFKIENYFGEYYNELLPYIKEQEYSNSNYTSDACNTNQDIIAKAKELLKKARKELSKACVQQLSITADSFSVLAERWENWDKTTKYHDMYNMFSLGNWMRSRLDKTIYKLRLISITFDFDNVDKLSIEFSNVTKSNTGVLSDIDSLLKQTSSISSTYDYVTEQAEKGGEANVAINNILKMGYDSALAAVMAGDNQEITMDRHGLLFRKYLEEVDDYSRFQMKMINRNIVMSDDGFKTAKLAIGLGVLPDGSLGYGIWADNIIGGNITCTNNLRIIGGKSSVIIDENGITLDGGAIKWINKGVTDTVKVYYAVSSSSTTHPTENSSEWKETFTGVLNNNYLWSKTVVTDTIGKKTITYNCLGNSPDGIKSTKKQYYLSTSKTSVTGGTWLDYQPTWAGSGYVWTKTHIEYISGATKDVDVVYDKGLTESLRDFSAFKKNVDTALGTPLPTTEIGSDYIISPKIGGGYLYISQNGGCSVEIDPLGLKYGNVFRIADKYNNDIMIVNSSGNGTFSGKVVADSGSIGGWNIDSYSLTNSDIESSSYIMTGDIDFNSTSGTGTRIGNGHILNGGKDGDLDGDFYRLAWIHNGVVDLYRQPYNTSSYRTIVTSDIIEMSKNDKIWFNANMVSNSFELYANMHISGNLLIDDNYYISSSRLWNGNIHASIIGRSSSGNIYVGMYYYGNSHHPEYTASIILSALNVSSLGTFHTPDGTVSTSDERLKTDICDIGSSEIDFILGLEAKKYKLKKGTSGRYHYGFIAQPVKELMDKTIGDVGLIVKSEKLTSDDPNYVPIDFENEDTYYYGLRYEEFIAPMVKTIQYQQKEIDGLEKRISILEEQK